ncbi:aldehyde dehydrogenase [Macrococcoides caseolyticum]|uniref:Aldehyde dehydrogenase n=1 Tax=Macrococcoides caseolyticum TaxID=69966 RepID=A0ACC9MPW6_9STAP|nr:aldehyde dehydrogenase [Macrococcus caseolyticus]PKE17370.1 aldehyde dehydrogenase [Macrococcus caseolyticus]PKE19410.1 aldehyde dehydrogenase [Macrococcus caseolyticus]PKE36060.1 aldehyde dehydrogenase [Macrococcus caseolyticus]PKE38735.1 aldehyde dehydrogenase [Macrococcus caseolyticus]PKE44473.1 aldehyde dehydrogenase [Macrococcus caseolyticus]
MLNSETQNVRDFFQTQSTKDIKFRKKYLKALKKSIKKHESDILDALKSDLGKNKVEAYATEVGFVMKELSYIIKELKNWAKTKSVTTPMMQFPAKSFIKYEPYGTVLIIGPFNYPFQLVMSPLIGALAAGNCAVVKPSEMTPQTSMVVQEILEEVFPPDYVKVVQGEKEVTSQLLDERFDYIFFTGSTKVGQIVYEKASKHLTPVTLELGGKSPVIIDDTANLKVAAERIAFGKFMNAGQTCVAPDYVLIDNEIKVKFVEALQATIQEFYGAQIEQSEDFGRIVNDNHFNRLVNIIEDSRQQVIYGGESNADELFVAPTIILDPELSDSVMQQEIFGPILPIIGYDTFNEVYDIVEQYEKPLALYLFTEDSDQITAVFNRLSFGGGCVNDTILHLANPNLPFGGVGHSGIGSYHGKYSFELFSHEKSYITKSTKLESGLLFPPYKGKFKYVKQLFK